MIADINQLLTDSLIYVGAYAQGQVANPEDIQLAFRVVNRKLDSLSAEKLSMVGISRALYDLTGEGGYAFGPGLVWDAPIRPIKIKAASTLSTNEVEMEAKILTADQWAAIPDKTRTGLYVESVYWDNGFPDGTIWVTPMPSEGFMVLYTYMPIPQLPAVTGTIDFAPGYEEAILTIAARELCIAFQRPLTPDLDDAATQSKQVIVQLSAEIFDAPMPPPVGPGPVSPPAERTA